MRSAARAAPIVASDAARATRKRDLRKTQDVVFMLAVCSRGRAALASLVTLSPLSQAGALLRETARKPIAVLPGGDFSAIPELPAHPPLSCRMPSTRAASSADPDFVGSSRCLGDPAPASAATPI